MVETLLSCILAVSSPDPNEGPGITVPLTDTTLDNGFRVLVVEDTSNPLVSVQVWYRAGSRYERSGFTGVSHFLEHMMFKGTEKRAAGEFDEEIIRSGGVKNAFTSEDKTAYWCVLPRSKLELAVEGAADRMRNAVFREFDSEKDVVEEERRLRYENQPRGVLYEMLTASSFIAHPYKNPVIGWMDDIDAITPEILREYYESYYAPNNAALIVAGDVRADDVFRLADTCFGHIPPSVLPEYNATAEPEQRGERRVRIEKVGSVRLLGMAFHIPEARHEDFPAVYMLSKILGDGRSSRLERSLVYEKNLVTDISVYADRTLDPGLLYIVGTARRDVSLETIEHELLGELRSIQENGVTPYELDKAKNKALHQFVFRQQSMRQRAYDIASYWITSEPSAINEVMGRIQTVTPEDIRRVARDYLREQNRTLVLLEPPPETGPEGP